MMYPVHSARILLRGGARYSPRFTQEAEVRADGATRITGLMIPDSPDSVAFNPPLADIPFRYIIPADAGAADYHRINVETWRRLQSDETLLGFGFRAPGPPSAAIHGQRHRALGRALFRRSPAGVQFARGWTSSAKLIGGARCHPARSGDSGGA